MSDIRAKLERASEEAKQEYLFCAYTTLQTAISEVLTELEQQERIEGWVLWPLAPTPTFFPQNAVGLEPELDKRPATLIIERKKDA